MAFGFTSIVADWATAYESETDQAVPFSTGEDERHRHEHTLPFVLVLHIGGQHEAAGKSATSDDARHVAENRSVAAEALRIECHAATDDDAYTLWANVCALLKQLHGDALNLGRFGWHTQNPNSAGPAVGWSLKWQDLTLLTPVPAALSPLVTIQTTGHELFFAASATDEGCQCDPPEEPDP